VAKKLLLCRHLKSDEESVPKVEEYCSQQKYRTPFSEIAIRVVTATASKAHAKPSACLWPREALMKLTTSEEPNDPSVNNEVMSC
jgi:hypothetical protein